MRNYKKYRSTVILSFQSFLAGKIDLHELNSWLLNVEGEIIKKDTTGKRVWFKFFNGDTGATGIYELYLDLYRAKNKDYIKECMQIAIDNPKGLQIYYS